MAPPNNNFLRFQGVVLVSYLFLTALVVILPISESFGDVSVTRIFYSGSSRRAALFQPAENQTHNQNGTAKNETARNGTEPEDYPTENNNNQSYENDNNRNRTADNRTMEHPNATDMVEIKHILDETYHRKYRPLNCTNKTLSRNKAHACLVVLSKKLNGSNIFSCQNLQGQYDCVAKSLQGCDGGAEAQKSFFDSQSDYALRIDGCALQPCSYFNQTVLRMSSRRPHSFKKFNPYKNNMVGNMNQAEDSHSNDAMYVLSSTASFLFEWLPKAVAVTMEMEMDDN